MVDSEPEMLVINLRSVSILEYGLETNTEFADLICRVVVALCRSTNGRDGVNVAWSYLFVLDICDREMDGSFVLEN